MLLSLFIDSCAATSKLHGFHGHPPEFFRGCSIFDGQPIIWVEFFDGQRSVDTHFEFREFRAHPFQFYV